MLVNVKPYLEILRLEEKLFGMLKLLYDTYGLEFFLSYILVIRMSTWPYKVKESQFYVIFPRFAGSDVLIKRMSATAHSLSNQTFC